MYYNQCIITKPLLSLLLLLSLQDVVAEWASDSGEAIPFLLVAGAKSFYKDFQIDMLKPGKSKLFNPQLPEAFEETEELITNRIRIKTHPWVQGQKKPIIDVNGEVSPPPFHSTPPHPTTSTPVRVIYSIITSTYSHLSSFFHISQLSTLSPQLYLPTIISPSLLPIDPLSPISPFHIPSSR